jgi:hypothetical protein
VDKDEGRWMRDEGRWMRDEGRWTKRGQTRLEPCKYIDEETFHRLDDSYEHIFAMLYSMEKKADTFCPPSS